MSALNRSGDPPDESDCCGFVRSRPCYRFAYWGSLGIAALMILACAIGPSNDDVSDKGNAA